MMIARDIWDEPIVSSLGDGRLGRPEELHRIGTGGRQGPPQPLANETHARDAGDAQDGRRGADNRPHFHILVLPPVWLATTENIRLTAQLP